MCIAAPGGILVIAAGVYSPLERISAFVAKYFSRKAVAILVFFLAFYDALFMASLLDQGGCSFKIFMADDGFVVAGKGIAISFSIVRMTIKLRICVGLLKNDIAGIFFVGKHTAHG